MVPPELCRRRRGSMRKDHGGTYRPPLPQRSGRAGDRDRCAGVHVCRGDATSRPPACVSSTWARVKRLFARTARRSIATIRHSIRIRRARRNARCRIPSPPEPDRINHGARASCHRRRRRNCRPDVSRCCLARAGMRVTVMEQTAKLEETGAGLQLSPNASRILIALGLRERIESTAVKPLAIRVMAGGSGREIARIPLGDEAERRYGAPYWSDPSWRPTSGTRRCGE